MLKLVLQPNKVAQWNQSGGWGLKNPHCGPLFFKYFYNSRGNNEQAFSVTFAPRHYNSHNHSHAPDPHMWQSPGPWPDSQRFQNSGNRTMSPDALLLSSTTEPLVHIDLQKKMVYDSSHFATLNPFFCVQDCRSRIAQVEYQGQTQYFRILDSKPSIDICYRIGHRLELKTFLIAQFCSRHRAVHQ